MSAGEIATPWELAELPSGGEGNSPTRSMARQMRVWYPAVFADAGEGVAERFVEYFAAQLRNPNTRRAYMTAWSRFLAWCEEQGFRLTELEPVSVAAFIEGLIAAGLATSTVKQHLAAIRKGFDYLVTGGVGLRVNPAAAVRGPRIGSGEGKTPVLYEDDARAFLESIDCSHVVGLRDRAILAVMVYSFARVGAVVQMQVGDFSRHPAGAWFVLKEKGGKDRRIPAHSKAANYIDSYLEAAGIAEEKDTPLFRSTRGRTKVLTENSLHRTDVLRMIKRRSREVGFDQAGSLCCHSWRATGITDYLDKGGRLEVAAEIAGHASTQTTRCYDRRRDKVRREEIERIRI